MIKKRKKLTRVKNILIPLINANLSGEGGKKTRDKPRRRTIEVEGRGKKDWKICIISRWISLNSFVPRGSLFLFERRWAAFSANEKLINSRWRCWQSEEHAAPRINSPPFSPLSSLKRAALKKREREKKNTVRSTRSRARYHPLDREEQQRQLERFTWKFNVVSRESPRDIESKMEEMRRFQDVFFFHLSIFHLWQFKFLLLQNLEGKFVIKSTILNKFLDGEIIKNYNFERGQFYIRCFKIIIKFK